MILFEAFYHKKPLISHLQLFGRKCFIHIPKERRLPGSKLMLRAEKGIFLGYSDTPYIYKVHIIAHSHTFIVSALDVKFEDVSAMAELTMSKVTMPDINLTHDPTTTTLILFAQPITQSMANSQQQSIEL